MLGKRQDEAETGFVRMREEEVVWICCKRFSGGIVKLCDRCIPDDDRRSRFVWPSGA